MANNNTSRTPLSPSSISSVVNLSSRRGSITSLSVSSQLDREHLAQALDQIHTSASQSDSLTTFNDFGAPPGGAPVSESRGTTSDIVQQGLSGLYTRLKEAVGVGPKISQETDEGDAQDVAEKTSSNPRTVVPKASIPSLSRGDTGGTASTMSSKPPTEFTTATISTSRVGPSAAETHSQAPSSSKASSIATVSAPKSVSSSQSLPKMAKAAIPTVVDPAVAAITVSAFKDKDVHRNEPARTEDGTMRNPRRSISKLSEGSKPTSTAGSENPNIYDASEQRKSSNTSRNVVPNHARKESLNQDGNTNTTPTSAVTSPSTSSTLQVPSTASRVSSAESSRKPAVIDRISRPSASGELRSRSSSLDPSTTEPSPISTSAHNSVYHESFKQNVRPEQLRSGAMRIPGTTTDEGATDTVSARLEIMRKQVLSKDFWMADETCKECFLCGSPFSAFRRKHHCRTCGCIFDSKCTSIISGQKFGVPGSLRVCKTCLDIINRRFKPAPTDERAPFRKSANEELGRKPRLPAFHDDNIIDPELAPYMSEESSGDEQMSIFETLASNDLMSSSLDPDKASFGPFLSAGRKHRMRQDAKSVSGLSFTTRGPDDGNAAATIMNHGRPQRRRNMSTASASVVHHLRSPRPKSGVFSKGPAASAEGLGIFDNSSAIEATKLTKSDAIKDEKSSETELSPLSSKHVKKLLLQLLQDDDVPNPAAWEKALTPILIRCSNDVNPDTQNGDVMDIRHYVKLKKIPGGKTGDTSYVSGVIFTKNLALKSMPRRIVNARIVIVTFPIEYQRYQQHHFMSLQPVIEQEKEYLRVVVNRILALRPQVLLAEKSVAGVALQFLSEAGISVAYNVKQTVLEAVSRCAKTEIISSLDMLALPVQVGQCGGFEVKTYVNNDFPGRKKTYIFISGCEESLGCTIALRGASTAVLRRMKRITEFMIYVVYNLKLESCLLRDQGLHVVSGDPDSSSIPSTTISQQPTGDGSKASSVAEEQNGNGTSVEAVSQGETEKSAQLGDGATQDETSQPSDSASTLSEQAKKLIRLHESHSRVSHDSQVHVPEDVPAPTYYSDMVAKYETKILSASPFVKFAQPYLLMKAREQERRLVYLKRLRDQDIIEEQSENEKAKPQRFRLIKPEMVHEIGQKAPKQVMEVLHAVHDAEYDRALYNYQTQTRQWENYLQGSLDLFDPYAHQNIVVLYSVICTETKIPCAEPGLIAIGFYREDPIDNMDPDCTLGQYIEDLCESSNSICHANGCERQMADHHRTYVHDEARITIFVDKTVVLPPEVEKAREELETDDDIFMWSYCKICKRDMGFMPMSESTWKYSFGKYLELSFWSKGLRLYENTGCSHDYIRDHIRYFNYRDASIRMHHDPIDLREIIVPRARITWKVEHDLRLKNEIFIKTEERWNRFMNSVRARLKSIRIDSVLPEKADACKAEVERLMKKAADDQPALIRDLQNAYMESKYYEIIPINATIRQMLEKAVEWDSAFAKFEADFLSDKDVRQLTIMQLKKMFGDNDSKESLPTTITTDGTSVVSTDTEDKPTPQTTQTTVSEPDGKQVSQPSTDESTDLSPSQSQVLPEAGDIATVKTTSQDGEAVLESVEPLDLATSKSPSLSKTTSIVPDGGADTPKITTESIEDVAPPNLPSAVEPTQVPAAAPPLTSSLSLTEKVEQLRRQHQAMVGEQSNVPDRAKEIPRAIPERGSSRRAGLTVSPPMVRAISTPAGTLPRTHSSLGRPLTLKDVKPVDTASGDLSRIPTGDSLKTDKRLSERFGIAALKSKKAGQSSIPRYVHPKTKEPKVSALARHFEQLSREFSREFEKERIRDRKQRAAKLSHSRAFLPRTSTKAIVEVYEDVDQAVQEPGPSDDDHLLDREHSDPKSTATNTTAETAEAAAQDVQTSQPERDVPPTTEQATDTQPKAEGIVLDTEIDHLKEQSQAVSEDEGAGSDADQSLLEDILPGVQEIADSLESSEELPLELPKHQKSSLMKMLSTFWAERSASGWPQLDYPLNATDHIFIDSDVIVREDEPSSLIAFALSSEDYQAKLADIRRQWKAPSPEDGSGAEAETKSVAFSDPGEGIFSEEELEKSLLRATGTHLKYQFTEGSAKMLCKIFYAEQFDALRRKCGVGDRFVESLSRCVKWDSKGGKTKSVFLKTLDDRMIIKSLSPIETSAFLRFAPAYFNIMAEALFHELPSVIAKMLGFFQIIIKNPVTNTELKLDLLVMENLFYDRIWSRLFDLKGSMRNRKIQSTGEQNEVLLDENMVEYIYESPLFAREHSKKLLRASVWNDTLFLARQNVMDYSLMICVDETRKELVVGIIDCIRTYTWDKRLESWIKDRGFAGGGRNRPTVTSPKEYKSRFREAMARYILQAPNCWHQFGVPQQRARFEDDQR
ncbi:1-phosphatidylinositol-3-phosphate 5-kinase FAB1 [Pleurostoma richardsiae]|uniref:1-phosphatidylinositol-3-phosphate 5-kinase n=1 Tax=Pleurostoma richardsiae TaxID=41990 RepID=A0AA38RN63_9PEZI|nr:1-phosphatidylinositol-3-phosphate 5-kinase FAB1 [Pleurostoma richardsiae]